MGTIQDAGSPHIACKKKCCKELYLVKNRKRLVTALGILDSKNQETYLFEASPDMTFQMKMLNKAALFKHAETPDGIFLTHAHIGHYTGLMYLGKEAMDAKKVPVFAMPRMGHFLKHNGPWSQLYERGNINIKELLADSSVQLNNQLKVTPIRVPHRDEFSETVGYKIEGPNKTVLFIPDIDKWTKWSLNIIEEIKGVDEAFIDGTFFSANEISGRSIDEIPHPLISESMNLFEDLSEIEKSKIHFIHFNHTNPVLNSKASERKIIKDRGFKLAKQGMLISL
ncbi:MBL fold metallo-hydrolase [Bacteroidia bacterium]|nr:MBL fold metallo-hydrolase [Bacteroidia bacterium]